MNNNEELKSIDDHFDLLGKLISCSQGIPDGEGTDVVLDATMAMLVTVTESLHGLVKFVVNNSKKYQKKPSFFERLKQSREEERQRKLLERLEDEEYAEYLRQKETQAQAEETPQERPEGEEQPEAGLPVVQPTTSPEVVEKADDGITKPMEW